MTQTSMSLAERIAMDVKYHRTADRPFLRFAGPQKVFLWDDLQEEKTLMNELFPVNLSSDCRRLFTGVKTEGSYVPYYNINADKTHYTGYCLEEWQDANFIEDLPDYCNVEAKPLRGNIFGISLEALEQLDLYYSTGYNYTRVLIDVSLGGSMGAKAQCWAWFNDIDDLCEYDEKEKEFRLKSTVDIAPFVEHGEAYAMS